MEKGGARQHHGQLADVVRVVAPLLARPRVEAAGKTDNLSSMLAPRSKGELDLVSSEVGVVILKTIILILKISKKTNLTTK